MDENAIIAAIDDELGRLRQVRALLSGVQAAPAVTEKSAASTQPAKPGVSPAARRRMAEAQKKRWAAVKAVAAIPAEKVEKEASKAAANESPQGRRLSPEARKRIVAAQKKRWAAVRAAKSTPAKKAAGKTAKKAAATKGAAAKKAPAKAVTEAVKTANKSAGKSTGKATPTAANKAAGVPTTPAPAASTGVSPL